MGENLAQRLVILTGTSGGGKGTFIRVLQGIIGAENVATMRPNLLGERFERGRFYGKSLLYGADVPEDFLNCKGASELKSLTGGDPLDLEFKGSNDTPAILCRFNAIVTCNSRLTVHLEGDVEAWRRRLAIIEYLNAKPAKVITDLSEQILAKEGPGVLNWMLDGLEKLRADGWELRLNAQQQKVVDDLLLESEAEVVFASECLQEDATGSLTVADCYEAYVGCHTAAQLEAALASRWVCFSPHRMFPGNVKMGFRWFCHWVFNCAQRGPGEKIVSIPEAWKFCTENAIPFEFASICNEGRELGIQTLIDTQHPSLLNSAITGASTELVCFKLIDDDDLREVRRMRPADPAAVSALPLGSFLAYNRLSGGSLAGRVF